jgi:hypothetical protein
MDYHHQTDVGTKGTIVTKTCISILLALAMTGCGGLPKDLFANRLSRTLAGDKLIGNSMYSFIGISSEFHKDDLAAINALLAPPRA